ncbi:putative ATP-dependent RNA helicase TDRD12 [Bufo bufo]|uniref:putative ATP-dependent RNA helicase TDRD12 n=1 Tax=Bufo bufo TaxID=8384 RepID=UPI001ABE4571|nr:putative ATP-dependent RNA helicase TDRD12 [Bufo bufo]
MLSLSVLKVVDPSCFFCRTLGDSEEYEQLFAQLNFLYSTAYRDVEELKPDELSVGALCVVFNKEMKSWCRAILESSTCMAQDELVDCFLLDYALYCPIMKKNIRFPVEECRNLPFRARKFKLHHIQPISLRFNVFENKLEMGQVKRWDTAAIDYFRQLLSVAAKIEAQLCSVENNCMAVYLFVTTADSVICVNDDLVVKKYAGYEKGNPNDKIENGRVGIFSAPTRQNACISATDVTETSPLHGREAAAIESSSDAGSLQSEKEKPSNPLSKYQMSVCENGRAMSPPQDQPQTSSDCPKFKVVTSPDPFLHPVQSNAEPAHRPHTAEAPVAPTFAGMIREAAAIESSSDAASLQSEKEKPSNPLRKYQMSVCENGRAMSPPQDQPQTSSDCPKFKVVTSPDPFLHPVQSKAEPAHRPHTAEAPVAPTFAGMIREAAIESSSDAGSLQSEKEKSSNPLSKYQMSVCENGRAMSPPRDQPQTLSDCPKFKVVTSPDPFLRPVQSKAEPAHRPHTEAPVAPTFAGMIREEKPNQTLEEMSQTECDTEVQSNPAPFMWPAYSKRDTRRRLSTEITEKSLTKVGSVGENEPILRKEVDNKKDLVRLLQFLSPTPRELLEMEPAKPLQITNPESAIFVSKCLVPCYTLEEISLCTNIKKGLLMCGYDGPNQTESYCWAPIAEGFDTIVICPDGSNPIYYIPPLLSYLNCASLLYKLLPAKHGPLAVIICPGWNKAHLVYDLLLDLSKYTRLLSPMLLLVGLKKEDLENINFRRQCDVLVTTPHSLLRCLAHHGRLLLRLCNLVFDEVDVLFSKAGSEISEILQIYKKIVSVENRDGAPQQIVAVGSKWTHDMQLVLQYMATPRIVITKMEQAAVFANVQQVIQLCLDCDKMSLLTHCLDFTPVKVQKILIFTKNDEEAELVHKAVQTASLYSLLLHSRLVYKFSHIVEQWKRSSGLRTVVVLVVTDDYVPLLEITDATCVIHYSFPENVGVLNLRLFSLLEYIQCSIDKISMQKDDHLRAKSVILMTEKHASFAIDLLKSMKQAQAEVPPALIAHAQGLLQSWENKKRDQELCPYLKSFGYCKQDDGACPHRHHINPSVDFRCGEATIPESDQYITVVPLCIVDAARFRGRVVTKNDPYNKLAAELNEYYGSPNNKEPVRQVECKHLYAISDASDYYRVQVLSTKTIDTVLFAHIQYVDDGRTDVIPIHTLFLLPVAFQSVPAQFREFIVCRVKPVDNEDTWDPKVTKMITRSVRGKQHRAKVVLHLGDTYWLDPMVQVTRLSDLASCVYDLNVRQEILSTGLGTDNPQHILQLKALLEPSRSSQTPANRKEEDVVPENDPAYTFSRKEEDVVPENDPAYTSNRKEEDVVPENDPAYTFNRKEEDVVPENDPAYTFNRNEEDVVPENDPAYTFNRNEEDVVPENDPADISMSPPPCLKNTDSGNEKITRADLLPHPDDESQSFPVSGDSEHLRTLPSASLFPEVKWFEKDDSVTLTVKLRQVTEPKCTFYSDRLVFSCYAGGKHYVADMDLYKDIVADKSECTVKNGEAVITVQKSKAELWDKLLKLKHRNVSFDFDHFEDLEENKGSNFGLDIPKKFYNVISEDLTSSEYSSSDSD